MDNMLQGTHSPMNLAERERYPDFTSGSSWGLFRMDEGLVGTGMKPAKRWDEVWILAGSKLPMPVRKRLPPYCVSRIRQVCET